MGGHEIAKNLRRRGLDVRIQDELDDIPRQLEDPEWAKLVAERGWVAITRDKRIRYRTPEKQAITDAKLMLFVLRSRGNVSRSDIIDLIADAAPRMRKFMREHKPPFIAGIYRGGRFALLEKL